MHLYMYKSGEYNRGKRRMSVPNINFKSAMVGAGYSNYIGKDNKAKQSSVNTSKMAAQIANDYGKDLGALKSYGVAKALLDVVKFEGSKPLQSVEKVNPSVATNETPTSTNPTFLGLTGR